MKDRDWKWLRFRLYCVLGLGGLLFVVILFRAFQLQLWQGPKLSNVAKAEIQKQIPRTHKRGAIYDRNRYELALTIEMESIFAQPKEIKNVNGVTDQLGPLLNLDKRKLQTLLCQDKPFVFLKRKATPSECETIRARGMEGVAFTKESQRFYPHMELASHVIGFIGMDPNGLEGLERQYNTLLKSPYLYEPSFRDALGRTFSLNDVETIQENEGLSLVLTLDKNIQYLTEKELKKGVTKAQAKGGIAVVMNPKSGEILALANYPTFNLNAFKETPPSDRRNLALTDTFEPGSTFKTFVLAAALEEKKFSPSDMIFCENGSYRVGSHIIHDVHRYGWLTFQDVIKVSSNIGATKIGKKVGPKTVYTYLKKFGFGKETGIDLPGEVPAVVWPYQHWGEIEASNICFGQGVTVTAIQMANALGAIANDGRLMKPYVVQKILDQKGNPVKTISPQPVRQVLSPETARLMRRLLVRVTEPGGTATTAAIDGLQVGGKTGTAQKVNPETRRYAPGKYLSTFMGFLPAEDPALVIVVMVDEPKGSHYGGVVAAPVFKAIAEQTLSLMGLKRLEPPPNSPKPSPQDNPNLTPWVIAQRSLEEARLGVVGMEGRKIMPDVRGLSMRKVVEVMKGYDLSVVISGTGKAVAQKPSPGTVISQGIPCQIQFQPLL
jgi:cell division protein FtsI (penicillin-binding protein 3)